MLVFSLCNLDTPIPDIECIIELRLDRFPVWDNEALAHFIHHTPHAVLLTLRSADQGGSFQGTESQREQMIETLLKLHPPFFDLEYGIDRAFFSYVSKTYTKTRFILSFHSSDTIDVENIYAKMLHYPAFLYKIAATPPSTHEAWKMLLFAQQHPYLSIITMGAYGISSRIIASVWNQPLHYAHNGIPTGSGQLSIHELCSRYRYPHLDRDTSLFGVIGDPVEHSQGPHYHNAFFQSHHRNAVYLPIRVTSYELEAFLPIAKRMGIRGLSVTMPLKERIVPFIDTIDPSVKAIGAINTLCFHGDRIQATNTDGIGAIEAIHHHTPIQGKKIVILGGGGSARAIAYTAYQLGATIAIHNRTLEKAKAIAQLCDGSFGNLEALPQDYDILINSTSHPMPISEESILPSRYVMDITYSPKETTLLKRAHAKGCSIIYGEEMFVCQAQAQTNFWLSQGVISSD